jgi:hypothetical protein
VPDLPLFQRGIEGDLSAVVNPSKSPFTKGDFKAGTARLPCLQRGIEGDFKAVVNLSKSLF